MANAFILVPTCRMCVQVAEAGSELRMVMRALVIIGIAAFVGVLSFEFVDRGGDGIIDEDQGIVYQSNCREDDSCEVETALRLAIGRGISAVSSWTSFC